MSHTPGPWSLAPAAFTPLQLRMVCGRAFDGSEKSIVDRVRGRSPDEADANARLIAAAPELLAALKAMDALVASLWDSIPWGKTFNLDVHALNAAPIAAKAAIAKAEASQ